MSSHLSFIKGKHYLPKTHKSGAQALKAMKWKIINFSRLSDSKLFSVMRPISFKLHFNVFGSDRSHFNPNIVRHSPLHTLNSNGDTLRLTQAFITAANFMAVAFQKKKKKKKKIVLDVGDHFSFYVNNEINYNHTCCVFGHKM